MMHLACTCGDHPVCMSEPPVMHDFNTTLDVEKINCPWCKDYIEELGIDVGG